MMCEIVTKSKISKNTVKKYSLTFSIYIYKFSDNIIYEKEKNVVYRKIKYNSVYIGTATTKKEFIDIVYNDIKSVTKKENE